MTTVVYQRSFFADLNGKPLDSGKLYIGSAEQDPETNPIDVFWDSDLTIPATQPLSITSGYVTNSGARAAYYVAEADYSLRARNRSDVQVDYVSSAGVLREVPSLLDFGTIGNNALVNTATFQRALDSGAPALFIPPIDILVGDLMMPLTPGFTLFGAGFGSNIIQAAGTVLQWPATGDGSINYPRQVVRDLQFTGIDGTDHTINTSYVGNVDFRRLLFTGVPVGKAAMYLNGSASTYTHDIRLTGIEILAWGNAGDAGIIVGPKSADFEIRQYTFNGNFETNYAIKLQPGAGSIYVGNSHIYNAKLNVLFAQGMSDALVCNDVCFDNALADLVYVTNSVGTMLADCRFQMVRSGQYAITVDGCADTIVSAARFDGAVGALGCIRELNGSTGTKVIDGAIAASGNFTTLFPATATVRYFTAKNPLGYSLGFSGASTAAITPSGSTYYLGVNGVQTASQRTVYIAPYAGALKKLTVKSTVTPGSGYSYTFAVYVDGVSVGSGTITNGNFQVAVTLTAAVSEGSEIYIAATIPTGSASPELRYFLTGEG